MTPRSRTVGARSVAAGTALVAGALVVSLAATGDQDRREARVPGSDLRPVSAEALQPVGSCDALLAALVEAALPEVTPWGWGFGAIPVLERSNAGGAELAAGAPAGAGVAADSGSAQSTSATGTNTQEAGVDEPDVAKTDGRYVYRVVPSGGAVAVLDTSGAAGTATRVARIDLPQRAYGTELLLAGDRLVVLGSFGHLGYAVDSAMRIGSPIGGGGTTRLLTYDVSDPAAPVLVTDDVVEGTLLGARLHGGGDEAVVRASFSHSPPALDFVRPSRSRTRAEARAANRALVRASTIGDWLPRVRPGRGSGDGTALLDCTDVRLPGGRADTRSVSLVGWPAADGPAAREATAVTTDSTLLYASADRAYLATTDYGRRAARTRTHVHGFALDGTGAAYVGSGTVPGSVRDRWSFDAHDATLRVASAVGEDWEPEENVVTVLAERGDRLEIVGRVGGMGVKEQIQSVRWFDDLAVLVTFRQVDPLYTVDLRDPTEPRLLGELKIPGFSAYLHPIGEERLLGLGQDADERTGRTRGAQASLFDLSDLTDPRRTAVTDLGRRTHWTAEWEPRAMVWLADRGVGLAVAESWGRSGGTRIVLITPGADSIALTDLPVEVERWWGGGVRMLPLADGRVAVTTRDGVALVDLPVS